MITEAAVLHAYLDSQSAYVYHAILFCIITLSEMGMRGEERGMRGLGHIY